MSQRSKKPRPKNLSAVAMGLGLVLVGGVVVFLAWGYIHRRWDGQSRFTVVDLNPAVQVLSFDPATAKGVRLVLPPDLEVETLLGRGAFPAASLSEAGPRWWAAGSVANYLGVFSQGAIADLGWMDRLSWWWKSREVKWQTIDLVEMGLVDYRVTADGARVGQLAPSWNSSARDLFASLKIAQQELNLKVVNTTAKPGLAASAARQIESSGISVVETSSAPLDVDRCLLTGTKELQNSIGVRLLLDNFGCTWQAGSELALFLGRGYDDLITGSP